MISALDRPPRRSLVTRLTRRESAKRPQGATIWVIKLPRSTAAVVRQQMRSANVCAFRYTATAPGPARLLLLAIESISRDHENMTRICVTGASGRAGRVTVKELLAHGYDVVATDVAAPREDLDVPVLRADLIDYGQTVEMLQGVDAVVHLANIPAPGLRTPVTTFTANTAMNYHVFSAATQVGLRRVVWASSETTLGLPFDTPPRYAPIDEDHYPHPTTSYALSKVTGETLAEHFAAWSGIPFVGLRFSNILGPDEYALFPEYWKDPRQRRWNLWGYIDQRDAAMACRLALEADVQGSSAYIIAAADTVMNRPSAELLREVYPGTPLTRDVGEHGTLLAIDRARDVLGFTPQHSWRQHVSADDA